MTSDNLVNGQPPFMRQSLPYAWLESLKQMQSIEADVLIPGHGPICDRSYLPKMSVTIQYCVDAVKQAIEQGMSLEEAQKKISILDRYPAAVITEQMRQAQPVNIARIYTYLKNYS